MCRGDRPSALSYLFYRAQIQYSAGFRRSSHLVPLRDAQAYLYAGGGIVRDSDPDAELAETRLKQRALLGALGVIK